MTSPSLFKLVNKDYKFSDTELCLGVLSGIGGDSHTAGAARAAP